MLFTASDGWGFFLTSSPILDLEHFSQVIYELYYRLCPPQTASTPTIQVHVHSIWWQHLMVGFFFDLFSYSGLRAFFTSDFTNCTTDYAPPKLTQPSGAVHSIWWLGFFFFDLFSYSGLRAFFTSDFTNCTTDYAPPQITPTIRCCSQHLMVGVFFLTSSPILDLEHFYKFTNWTCFNALFSEVFSYSGLRAFFTSELYYRLCPLPQK